MEYEGKLTEVILVNGYIENEADYICLYCGKKIDKNQIFKIDEGFYNSFYAIKQHLEKSHGGPLKALLNLASDLTGISESQKNLMSLLALDLTDQEIAEQLEITPSTIRNHRFKLREKKRQALYFLAVMDILEQNNQKLATQEISIANYDERFQIKEQEREKVLSTFLDAKGKITQFPRKEKSKIILLQYLSERFSDQRTYTEKEVNQIIQEVFTDFVTLRRYLIEYGVMARTHNGEKYWKL